MYATLDRRSKIIKYNIISTGIILPWDSSILRNYRNNITMKIVEPYNNYDGYELIN